MNKREKLLLIVPVLLALLVGGGPVIADPVGAVRRIVYTCQTSAPAPINTDRTWVKCSNHHAMRTNTSNVDVDLESGGGGSGMAIGDSVTGATAGRCLFSATGPVLADDAGCTYDAAGNALTLTGSIITPTIGTSGAAQHALPSGTAALATISDASGIAAIYANATATTQNEVALTTADGPVIWTLGGGMSEMMTWFDSSRDWQYFGIKDGAGAETLYAEGPWDWQATIPGGYITLENNTPATGPVPIQCGGDIKLEGRCWDGSASRECSGLIASKSETSGAAYTGEIDFYVVRNTTTTRVGGFSYNGTTNVFDAVNVTASSSINTPTIGTDASNQHAPPSGSGALCSVDATQTLTNKTLTAPVINGATSASGNFDLSGSNGDTKTTTGNVTLSGHTAMASGKTLTVNNVTTNGFVGPNYGGTSTNVPTVTWISVGGGGGAPAFTNSWTNDTAVGTYPTAAFFKDAIGQVHLKGYVTGGSVGTTVFVLPAGYRPLQTQFFYNWQGTLLLVYANGNVDVAAAGAASSGMFGTFMAEQ